MTKRSDAMPPHYRWNFVAFSMDYIFFGVALAFIRPDSVLPAFVRRFTTSAPVIGLVSTVWNGFWLLPQVVAARWINDKPHKKPYLMWGLTGRITFWIMALALWLGVARNPVITVILLYVCIGVFTLTDGLASVAWFDMLAGAIPGERRGRLMGVSQIVSGLAGLGVGWLIGRILQDARFSFPTDYALIFTLAGLAFVPSVVALALLRETRRDPAVNPAQGDGPDGWLTPLLHDPIFRQLMACRILVGMVALVTPFYVVHATDVLRLSPVIVGSFVAAQQAAGVASGALLGWVSDRWGPRHTIRIGSALSIAGPLFALLAHLVEGGVFARAYPLVYVALGIYQSSTMLGFYNYLLEVAPEELRPSYIGLGNTIIGVLTVAPTVGGWLLEATSYTVLFATAAGLVTLGFLIALRIRPSLEASADPTPLRESQP